MSLPKYIQIIGYSGAGKSHLASVLGTHYNLPVLHMDTVHFIPSPNWIERTLEDETALVRQFLATNSENGWVIDGKFTKVAPERFELADLSIYLDYGRWYCLWSCLKRWWRWKGRVRESSVCPETMDWSFLRWILWDGRGEVVRGKNEESLARGRGEKLVFKSRSDLEAWLSSLKKEN